MLVTAVLREPDEIMCNPAKLKTKATSEACPFCQHRVWSLCPNGRRHSQMFFQGMSVMFVVRWQGGGFYGEAVKASLFATHKIVVFGSACHWCEKTACLGKCVRIIDWRLF